MHREIQKAYEILTKGGCILYPTDTLWGIGCDATNNEAVLRIYRLKQRVASKSMIALVSDEKMLLNYIQKLSDAARKVLHSVTKPTTIVYDHPTHLAPALIAPDNTVGIRLVKDPFCKGLIEKTGKPIVATSANISGSPAPKSFKEIDSRILQGVDYVVHLHRDKRTDKASDVIRINDKGEVTVIRN